MISDPSMKKENAPESEHHRMSTPTSMSHSHEQSEKGGLGLSGLATIGLALGAGWLLATQYPDIKRYLKMRNM